MNVEIKISGPDGCLDREIAIVYKALTEAKYNVTLSGLYDPPTNLSEWVQHNAVVHDFNSDYFINIKVDEQPWGS